MEIAVLCAFWLGLAQWVRVRNLRRLSSQRGSSLPELDVDSCREMGKENGNLEIRDARRVPFSVCGM